MVFGAQARDATVRRRRRESGHEGFDELGAAVGTVVTARRVGHEQNAPGVADGLGKVAVAPHADEMPAIAVEMQDGAHLAGRGQMPEKKQTERRSDAPAEQRQQHGGLADRQTPAFGVPLRMLPHPVADADVHDPDVKRDVAAQETLA